MARAVVVQINSNYLKLKGGLSTFSEIARRM